MNKISNLFSWCNRNPAQAAVRIFWAFSIIGSFLYGLYGALGCHFEVHGILLFDYFGSGYRTPGGIFIIILELIMLGFGIGALGIIALFVKKAFSASQEIKKLIIGGVISAILLCIIYPVGLMMFVLLSISFGCGR